MVSSHDLCRLSIIPPYDDSMHKNMNYELSLLKKLYYVWMRLWDLIYALGKYALNLFMICFSYDMMINVMDMLMTYDFPLSSK